MIEIVIEVSGVVYVDNTEVTFLRISPELFPYLTYYCNSMLIAASC